jgi:hypothetical protein
VNLDRTNKKERRSKERKGEKRGNENVSRKKPCVSTEAI